MKTFDEIRELAKDYASKELNKEAILFDPVFRSEDGKLRFAYMVVEFSDESKIDYRIKRPKKWLLQDIESGEVVAFYDIQENDFSNLNELPLDTLCDNDGKSILFDYSNSLLCGFKDWEKKTTDELKMAMNKDTNLLYDDKTLKIDNELISPKDYILANLEGVIGEMYDTLFEKINSVIGCGYQEYYNSLFESIRERYVSEDIIDEELIKKYMNYVKYLWPESKLFFNKCSNIPNVIDEEYDKAIDEMLKSKNN